MSAQIHPQAVQALKTICDVIDRNYGTSQRKILTLFLAGLYNSSEYEFPLTDLRRLDDNLAHAALLVLQGNTYGPGVEIHNWGVVDAKKLNTWFLEDGHKGLERAEALEKCAADLREGVRKRTALSQSFGPA